MNQLLSVVSTLQIIVHLNLMNIKVPPNVQIFNKHLLNIVAFDVLDTQDVLMRLLDLQPSDAYTDGFETLGYETAYFTINMGSIFVYMILFPVLLIFLLILKQLE